MTLWNSILTDKVQIVGCINSRTLEVKPPKSTDHTACYYGGNGGRQNIMLPPLDHIQYRKKYRQDDKQIFNRLVIANFESSFNPDSKGKGDNGYLQIRTSVHGTISKGGIDEQLKRLKTREQNILSEGIPSAKRCGIYRNKDNKYDGYSKGEEAVLACYYRYHNHSVNGTHYADKLLKARNYLIKKYLPN